MKTCKQEGCTNPVFSKGFCKYHTPRKAIKKISKKQKEVRVLKQKILEQDLLFYASVWDNRPYNHFCYECGAGIAEPHNYNFHHILAKAVYPQFRYTEENIVILCLGCHSKVETMIDKCPKVKHLTEKTRLCLV